MRSKYFVFIMSGYHMKVYKQETGAALAPVSRGNAL